MYALLIVQVQDSCLSDRPSCSRGSGICSHTGLGEELIRCGQRTTNCVEWLLPPDLYRQMSHAWVVVCSLFMVAGLGQVTLPPSCLGGITG